jgi:hypothetical protein
MLTPACCCRRTRHELALPVGVRCEGVYIGVSLNESPISYPTSTASFALILKPFPRPAPETFTQVIPFGADVQRMSP